MLVGAMYCRASQPGGIIDATGTWNNVGVGGHTASGLQGGVWACWEHIGSAGWIGSDCRHLLAIRPIWECVFTGLRHRRRFARAIWDRLGLHPEEHRRRFRPLSFAEEDRPFAYAQQLRDQARKWLVPDRNTPEGVVKLITLERFIEGLPARTSTWVRYHRSAAVDLAESHLPPLR